jgi:gluconokinase
MFIILMGVSGSGKTTIGAALAARMGLPFYDGDDYHTPANRSKMAAGVPLTDDDRQAWLETLAALIRDQLARGAGGVLACSALKARYRAILQVDAERVTFVYLRGSYETIRQRILGRGDHYMKAAMLPSQFDALEEPEGVLTIDVVYPPEEIIRRILVTLG